MRISISIFCIAASLGAFSETAHARRYAREGINFGSSFRLASADNSGTGASGVGDNAKVSSDVEGYSPFIGYAFGNVINLGIAGSYDRQRSLSTTASNGAVVRSSQDSTIRGGGIFTRFLFGGIFFFELGGGIYQANSTLRGEVRRANPDGSFTGEEQNFSSRGIGPGFHGGAGAEVAMGSGFYFTMSYMLRRLSLKDTKDTIASQSSGDISRTELNFGLAHYVP